jgi:hypothetical protein
MHLVHLDQWVIPSIYYLEFSPKTLDCTTPPWRKRPREIDAQNGEAQLKVLWGRAGDHGPFLNFPIAWLVSYNDPHA